MEFMTRAEGLCNCHAMLHPHPHRVFNLQKLKKGKYETLGGGKTNKVPCPFGTARPFTGHMWIAGVECPFNGLCTLTLRRILSPRVPRCLIAVNSWLQDFYPFPSSPFVPSTQMSYISCSPAR